MATIDEIKQQAAAVKNATQVGENTAERVGGALAGLAEIAEQQDSKLSEVETDLYNRTATKFYVSEDSKGGCTAKFDDENGTVVFSPIVSMRRLNGERDKADGTQTDIHEKLVAAGCSYDEKTKLCTASLGKNPDNKNFTVYYLNGTYGVTSISYPYNVPSNAEIVLQIARHPDTFYFMGGAAAIWTECYNNSKLKKVETDLAKKAATKFYVSNIDGNNDIMFSDNSITFHPIVSMRRLNGEKDKADGTQTDITELFRNLKDYVTIDSSTGKVTVKFDSVDNSNMTIYYYNGEYHVCRINVYEVPSNAELVLHCGRNAQGFYFMGGAASMWELAYNEWKLKKAETDIAKKAATKFYLSSDSNGACSAKFDDENGTVVFSPIVSMRRLNGERDKADGTQTDIHEKLVAAGCTYDEETKLCTLILGGNVDNRNLTIYRLNGTYGVTRIDYYEVPQDAEIVLHIAKDPDTFYFYGGAAAIWTARYNYLKTKHVADNVENTVDSKVVSQFSYKHPDTWSLGQKKITLLHFSDIHGDEKNFKRIVQYVEEKKSMLTDVICTGDIVNYQFSEGIDWWKNNIGDNKILMAIGNHDPLVTQGTFDWFGKNAAECYERYFSPYIANWGVNYTQDLCYYYKDYSDVSIRLIVLDGMRWNNIKEDAAQEEWFKQKLNDAKEKNLHVIIASHFPPDTSVGNKNNNVNFDCWYSVQAWETEQYGLLNQKVADSVDSFQKNGGNFICYIGGHTHGDLFRPLKRYPNQLMVIVANDSCYEHVNNADCWYSRSESDNSQDLFNLLNIDTENKILSIVRVGCCFDRYARHIGTISFDYENHKVLSQY